MKGKFLRTFENNNMLHSWLILHNVGVVDPYF